MYSDHSWVDPKLVQSGTTHQKFGIEPTRCQFILDFEWEGYMGKINNIKTLQIITAAATKIKTKITESESGHFPDFD